MTSIDGASAGAGPILPRGLFWGRERREFIRLCVPSSGAQASTKLRNYAVRQKLCIESARGYWAKKRLAHQLPGGEHGGIAPIPPTGIKPIAVTINRRGVRGLSPRVAHH